MNKWKNIKTLNKVIFRTVEGMKVNVCFCRIFLHRIRDY